MSALLIRVVAAVFSGFLFSQASEFTQQYLQRLGGAVDALAAVVQRFDASALAEGLSRQSAVAHLSRSQDAFVVRQGMDAATTIARYDDLQARYRDLTQSAPLLRPFVALSEPEWTVVQRTFEDFRPALPVTADGLFLTIGGFAGGWAGGAGAAGAHGMARRRRMARRKERGVKPL